MDIFLIESSDCYCPVIFTCHINVHESPQLLDDPLIIASLFLYDAAEHFSKVYEGVWTKDSFP